MTGADNCNEAKNFVEFRRKVRGGEVLSGSMEHLLKSLRFSGRVSVVLQNGRVLKSGYRKDFFASTNLVPGSNVRGSNRG
jgi:hypothetical protein